MATLTIWTQGWRGEDRAVDVSPGLSPIDILQAQWEGDDGRVIHLFANSFWQTNFEGGIATDASDAIRDGLPPSEIRFIYRVGGGHLSPERWQHTDGSPAPAPPPPRSVEARWEIPLIPGEEQPQ